MKPSLQMQCRALAVLLAVALLTFMSARAWGQALAAETPASYEQQVIELTNLEREKAGLPPLVFNEKLAQAAHSHSQAMADRDFFAHQDPQDKSGPGERVHAVGYDWNSIAENIGLGYASAEAAIEGWMNSPSHRANILLPDIREIGVGYVEGPGPSASCTMMPCQHYWTQLLGRRVDDAGPASTMIPRIAATPTAPAPAPTTASPTETAVVVAPSTTPAVASVSAVAPATAAPGVAAPLSVPSPVSVTLKLCPETPSVPQRVDVSLPPAPAKADVLFVFDVTGSMVDVLASAANNADRIMADLGQLIPDIQFGVVSLADYPAGDYGEPGDIPYTLNLQITTEQSAVRAALGGLGLQGGGDGPEAYAKAFHEIATAPSIGWRPGARHFVVSFGDSLPHDDDVNAGVPAPQPFLPGQVYDTHYDSTMVPEVLDWQKVLTELLSNDVTVLHVVSGSFNPEAIPSSSLLLYWQYWADQTGGAAVLQENASQLPETIRALVAQASRRINSLRLVPARGYTSWVLGSPPEYRRLLVPDAGLTQAFQFVVTPPKGTADGTYPIRIDVIGDGTVYATWIANVEVVNCGIPGCVAREERCKSAFPWLLIPWLLPLLLILLVLLLWWLAQRLRFGDDWIAEKNKRGLRCWIPCLLLLLCALLLAFLLSQRLSNWICQNSDSKSLRPLPPELRIVTPTPATIVLPTATSQAVQPTEDPQRRTGNPTPTLSAQASVPAPVISGSQRVALVGGMPDGMWPGVTFAQIQVSELVTTTLLNFDTLVLAQQCDVGQWPRQIHCDINQWVEAGGKLIIYDSDECSYPADYSWLPYPFTTDNPGAMGSMNGVFETVAEDSMLPKSGPSMVSDVEMSQTEIGDANVMVTKHLAWCGDAEARNLHLERGFVHAYAFWGKGLIIYNGLDTDSIGSRPMAQLWENELKQEWEGITGVKPVGLTCVTRVAGSPFYDIELFGFHIGFWWPWLLLPLLGLLCWWLCRILPTKSLHGYEEISPGDIRQPAPYLPPWTGPKVEWDPTPTVVIGLGGTGRWVLTYLKHNLTVAGAGRSVGPVQLLCLDSSRDEKVGGQPVSVRFAGAQLDDRELLVVGEDLGEVIRRAVEGSEPELAAWFPGEDYKSLRPAEKDAREGTGQRRPLGRAVVFRDIQRGEAGSLIWQRLNEALQLVQRDKQVQVFIVGSLGGGFGSGAFTDIAYLARLATQNTGSQGAAISAFLATEDVYAQVGATSQMRINTLAALRELDRFLLAQNRPYPMRYRFGARDRLSDRFLSQSLLDDCFIFDGHRAQQDLSNRRPQDGTFAMIADALQVLLDRGAREPGSTLAQYRSNTRPAIGREQVSRMAGVVSGLGCSVYRLPLLNLVQECNVRFARELVRLWLVGRNGKDADSSDEFGSTLRLDYRHNAEHRDLPPSALAHQLLQRTGDPVLLIFEMATAGWSDSSRPRLRAITDLADKRGRDRFPAEVAEEFAQWLTDHVLPLLNGRPETFDVVDARGGKLNYVTEFLIQVEALLAEGRRRINAHAGTVGVARFPNADLLAVCADGCRVAAERLRKNVERGVDFLLQPPVARPGETHSDQMGVYRRLVAKEVELRAQRAEMRAVLTRQTYADDALVNMLYEDYYALHLEPALERIFWRRDDPSSLELVVRHWEDRACTTDQEGREVFVASLVELADALGREVWRERLASRLDDDTWRSDRLGREVERLWIQAEPLLDYRTDQAANLKFQRFLWVSDEVQSSRPVVQRLTAVAPGGGAAREVRATDPYSAGLLSSLDVLPLPSLGCHVKASDEYLRAHALVGGADKAARTQRVEQVQVFAAEVNALAYERRLAELREPPRLFHPLFVAGLDNLARAKEFALAYACGWVVRRMVDNLYSYGLQLPGEVQAHWLPEKPSTAQIVDALVEALQEYVLGEPSAAPGLEVLQAELAARVHAAVVAHVPNETQRLQQFLQELPSDLRDRRAGLGVSDWLSFARLVVRDALRA